MSHMVFEAFVEFNGERQSFSYPNEFQSMIGSIFEDRFKLNSLSCIKGGISAGSIGIDFYSDDSKKLTAAIQVRSDSKENMLDIDCFTRKFFSDGKTEVPNGHTKYTEASFHNLPYDKVISGLKIGFSNNGSEVSQIISGKEIEKLFVRKIFK